MAAGERRRILIVEDEEKILRLLQTYLESVGFEVHGETHGAKAISYVAEHKPDLVILDLRLPDMGGVEVCQEIRAHYPSWEMPIMMLSAMDTGADQARGLEHGADAYVTKPFEPPQLLAIVTSLLNKVPRRDPEG